MVVRRFVRQALRGEAVEVCGDGSQSRCFCDVRGIVQAIILLADREPATGQLFNIGNTVEISILQLAQMLKELTRNHSPIRMIPYREAQGPGYEDMQSHVPDVRRLQKLLGWACKVSLDKIILDICAYEREQPQEQVSV